MQAAMSVNDITAFENQPPWDWWSAQRLRYNIGLVIAGILSFVCYASIIFAFENRIPGADINGLTTIVQGIGYLVMMRVANYCYAIGQISEGYLNPRDVSRFRRTTFRLGYWFSFTLPFLVPITLLCNIFF